MKQRASLFKFVLKRFYPFFCSVDLWLPHACALCQPELGSTSRFTLVLLISMLPAAFFVFQAIKRCYGDAWWFWSKAWSRACTTTRSSCCSFASTASWASSVRAPTFTSPWRSNTCSKTPLGEFSFTRTHDCLGYPVWWRVRRGKASVVSSRNLWRPACALVSFQLKKLMLNVKSCSLFATFANFKTLSELLSRSDTWYVVTWPPSATSTSPRKYSRPRGPFICRITRNRWNASYRASATELSTR